MSLLISQSLLAAVSHAQEVEKDQSEEALIEEEVVVTGTRLTNRTYTGISPVISIDLNLEKLAGSMTASEILQGSALGNGGFQINQQLGSTAPGGAVVNGGLGFSGFSLRGLGARRTLIVLDGSRLTPSGVQGRVSSVDLNILPTAAIDRIEIVKAGASSIYGADAVAGVVNGITKKNYDGGSFTISTTVPEQSGGGNSYASFDFGKTFAKGWFSAAAEYSTQERLKNKQRDYLTCSEDILYDVETGERADIKMPDGSYKCRNHNPSGAFFDATWFGGTFQPDDGSNINAPGNEATAQYLPGWVRTGNAWLNDFDQEQLSYALRNEDSEAYQNADATSPSNRINLFVQGGYRFSESFRAYGNLIYNHRESEYNSWAFLYQRMSANNPNNTVAEGLQAASNGDASGDIFYQTVLPYNADQTIDYFNGVFGLAGEWGDNWRWDAKVSYGRSDGNYSQSFIYQDRLDAISLGESTCDPSLLNPAVSDASLCNGVDIPILSSRFLLDQNWSEQERAFLLGRDKGNTLYEQVNVEATIAANLFNLPAGTVEGVVGIAARKDSIDDQPGINSVQNNLHSYSTAGRTKGSENVNEVFAELGIPILQDLYMAHSVNASISARYTSYDISGSELTSKAGINWSFSPAFSLRGNYGTSFRGASLYELHLANQTSFLSIAHPCQRYEDSGDTKLIEACKSLEIEEGFVSSGSVEITAGGAIQADGTSSLKSETSDSWSFGMLITPEASGFSLAMDYFETIVKDEIDTLGAKRIVSACIRDGLYCNLIDMNGPNDEDPYAITGIHEQFLNIDSQRVRGIDTTISYAFDFSGLTFFSQLEYLYNLENREVRSLGGVTNVENLRGDPNIPINTGALNLSLGSEDWGVYYRAGFIGSSGLTKEYGGDTFSFGGGGYNEKTLREDLNTGTTIYHSISASATLSNYTLSLGISNLLDEKPPQVSVDWKYDGYRTGTSAQNAWDLTGRRIYLTFEGRF